MPLRAPREQGQSLQVPPLSSAASLLDGNLKLAKESRAAVEIVRDLAKAEMIQHARQYSRTYSDVEAADGKTVVMSGHQPTLFHPGVWFKNFALDWVARSTHSVAINLVVDNDLCRGLSVPVPRLRSGAAHRELVSVDSPAAAMPFEMQRIQDRQRFESFGDRLRESIKSLVDSPLIDSLWPEVIAAEVDQLPGRIAAGRHRLEQKHGISNLEIPLGLVSTFKSFAWFFEFLAFNARRFREIHNESLEAFRRVNRVRSRSHPVPELDTEGAYTELPFWIWTRDQPHRQPLYCAADSTSVTLKALKAPHGWSARLKRGNFASDFETLNAAASEVFIRPRALTTTMFARFFASDLFIHGIGGAKYDQLGDEIASRFFRLTPLKFMTVSATMKLPVEFPSVTRQDVTRLKSQLRRLRYHPERELAADSRSEAKRKLLEAPPSGSRKAWRDKIDAINQSLFRDLESKRQSLEKQISAAETLLPTRELLDSREFSFALFPHSLIDDLRYLAGAVTVPR